MLKPYLTSTDSFSDQAGLAPLVLDVDNTLINTDILHESVVAYVKGNPLRIFKVFGWLMQGKATLKRKLSENVPLSTDHLPVNEDLAEYAKEAHDQGRQVGLATAADELVARRLAKRFDFVDFVIASDGTTNLKGASKAKALTEQFPAGFAYAGDSPADLTVWPEASSIILVGTSATTTRRALTLGKPIEAVFERPKLGLRQWAKALRVHQWAKNALVFVPLVLSGMASNPAALIPSLIAFVVMSLMASGTYLVNDLADLTDDRAHWSKKHRPLAAGVIALKHGVIAAAGLIAFALALATTLGLPALGLIIGYMALTLSYSFYLKRQPIVDVFALAVLFTLRIGIGIAAIAVEPSPWLLVFSMFLFGSLSFAKRQTEIQRSVANGRKTVNGRGYLGTDAGFVLSMGIAAGMGAVSIMVLYIMNDVYAATIYKTPVMLWVFPAVLFMWISRIWLLCHREQLNDDPVAFAIRDKVSIGLGGIMGAAFLWGWLI